MTKDKERDDALIAEVLEQARANRYTPVGSVRIMARFILSLDGAKGGE